MSAKKTASRIRVPRRGKPAGRQTSEILRLVKAGVKRFILHDAPIADFQKAVRDASRKGMASNHLLSGIAFRRIVEEAMQQRRRNLSRRRSKH